MIKHRLFIVLLSLFYSRIVLAQAASVPANSIAIPQPEKVGGWYPVFFEVYDQAQVDSIVQTIKDNKARRIVVLYDKNTLLANKIISSIQAEVNFALERSQDVPQDTTTTKYNHNQVVVTVFLKGSDGQN